MSFCIYFIVIYSLSNVSVLMTNAGVSSMLRLLFIGSDAFSLPTLRNLIKTSAHQIDITTKPLTLVDRWAKQQRLTVKYWPIEGKQYDIGLVISFGHMIDEDTISLCRKGIFNVHPSLLPRWRGSTPIVRAIQYGDKQTGVSLMRIKPHKFDVGEILMQRVLSIGNRDTTKKLLDRLALLGSNMTEEFLSNPDHFIAQAVPQREEGRTYAKKLTPECGKLYFDQCDSFEIDRKVRAFTTFINTYTYWVDGKKLSLLNSQDPNITNNLQLDMLAGKFYPNLDSESDWPGLVFYHKIRGLICIKCANQTWCAFSHVALQSKRIMTAFEFNNGYLSKLSRTKPIILRTV